MDKLPVHTLPEDFSLVQGGPLFQLFVGSRLSTPALGWLKRRIIAFIILTWLPLMLLSALSGQLSYGAPIPFLYDLEAHVRFLLALPLLLVAEWFVHRRMRPLVQQFLDRGIITPEIQPQFQVCITAALCWRNSMFIEIALFALALTAGHLIFFDALTVNASTWYVSSMRPEWRLSMAGYWLAYVSLPLYQFLLLRWLFRIVVWTRFLWQVSRLNLHLVPTHPDRAGGLGFLAQSAPAFMPFLLSQGALLSAMIANRILYEKATLLSFKPEIAVMAVLLLLLVLGPLCVFSPLLAKTKREGLLSYGVLASRYVREFDNKWLQGGAEQDEAFLGSGDIQSLADLNNSVEVIRTMQVFPFGRQTIIQTSMFALLPLLPLLLTMISLEDLVRRLIGILL